MDKDNKEVVSFPYLSLGLSRCVRKDEDGLYGVIIDWTIGFTTTAICRFDNFEDALVWAKDEAK